jgi:hypothetical protein
MVKIKSAEQVKKKLNAVYQAQFDYSVAFRRRKSNKVHGLYKHATNEIIIHNLNFVDDNFLMYTAIHELAHHICMTERGEVTTEHTLLFYSVFHDLLESAAAKEVYARKKDDLQKFVEQAKKTDREMARRQRELDQIKQRIKQSGPKDIPAAQRLAKEKTRLEEIIAILNMILELKMIRLHICERQITSKQ